jgi:hypothetical protein
MDSKTLNFYLSRHGIDELNNIISSYSCFTNIIYIINHYSKQLKYSLDNNNNDIIKEVSKKINNVLHFAFEIFYKKPCLDIYFNWIKSIQQYCFQGGYGHSIYYTGIEVPHHWCVKTEFYEIVKIIPEPVIIASILCNMHIIIEPKADYEIWST